MIKILRASKIGCHIIDRFIACILFADDMSLLAPTRGALQQLLDLCAAYCKQFCLVFNARKTKVLVFGRGSVSTASFADLKIGDAIIEYVSRYRYLGFNVISDVRLKFSTTECLRSFFGAVNSINSVSMCSHENVRMQLLYSNCVPKLTYGAAVRDLTAAEKHQYNVAVNNAARRIFRFRYWQSIRQLREFYEYDSIEIMFAKARKRFLISIANHENAILRFLHRIDVDN